MEITLEKIELGKDRTGVSYAEAKEALEAAEGSVVDAIISIEEKIDEETGSNFTKQGNAVIENLKASNITIETVEEMFAPKINKTADGWEIFYRVPYTLIRRFFPDFKVYSGKEMRANCYKCADLSEPPHYLSWNKIEGEPFTFHKRHCFGKINFVFY